MKAQALALLLWASGWPGMAVADGGHWPSWPTPPEAQRFAVMDAGSLNGTATRIHGLESAWSASRLSDWLRRHGPQPQQLIAEGGKTVISAMQGPFLHTVVVEPLDTGGASALITLARLPTPAERQAHAAERQRWRDAMPSATQVVSTHDIQVGRSWHRQVVMRNSHGVVLNLQRALELGERQGYRLAQGWPLAQDAQGPAPSQATVWMAHPDGAQWHIGVATEAHQTQLTVVEIAPAGRRP
jgi:hypothetical protein